jgi:hypothetical protein
MGAFDSEVMQTELADRAWRRGLSYDHFQALISLQKALANILRLLVIPVVSGVLHSSITIRVGLAVPDSSYL